MRRSDVDPADFRCVIVPGGDVEEPLHDRAGLALIAVTATVIVWVPGDSGETKLEYE